MSGIRSRVGRWGLLLGWALLWLAAPIPLSADSESVSSETEASSSVDDVKAPTPGLRPGKVDVLARDRDGSRLYNIFLWSPIFKGGGGVLSQDGAPDTEFVGGYVRPFVGKPRLGELILGGLTVDRDGVRATELQAEYRLPSGFGIGMGSVDRQGAAGDIRFGKLTYRQSGSRWSYILTALAQEIGEETSSGGWVALYEKSWMGVVGSDGEQLRATLGVIGSDGGGAIRPAAEVLYVDTTVGDIDGPKVWFVNATLGFRGGFLSHPARLGRAMGPTGLEYGNPLGFLTPTWNRRLELWELGQLVDARLERRDFPNGTRFERYEVLGFPFQFTKAGDWPRSLFAGAFYSENARARSEGLIAGLLKQLDGFQLSIGLEHDTERSDFNAVIGLAWWLR